MASSRVEIATSSPFGCVLKDHNRHNRCSGREGNAKAAATFQKNLKGLVRDHLHPCISVFSDENPQNHINSNPTDHQSLRCITSTNTRVMVDSPTMSHRQVRNLDRWAAKQAQEMVSTIEKQSEEAEQLIASSSSTGENSSNSRAESKDSLENRNLGASSLVQIWEARLHPSDSRLNRSNSLNNNQNPTASTSRTSFDSSYADNASSSPSRLSDAGDSTANVDWDSTARSAPSSMNSKNSVDAGERERLRIADIIRKLTSEANDQIQGNNGSDSPRRNSYGSDPPEQRGFSLTVNSPRIRGREAFNDLLSNMEQERHKELDSLAERQSVSRFPQRGRIQSLLRLKYMRRDNAIQDQQRPQLSRLRVCNLRERFSTGVDQDTTLIETPNPKSQTATPNNIVDMENSSTQNQVTKDKHHQEISAGQQSTPQVESCTSQICRANCHLGSPATMQQSLPQVENLLSHTSKIHEDSQRQGSSASDQESTLVETSLPRMTVCEESHHQETSTSEQDRSSPAANSILQTSNVHEEISANSDVTWQEIRQQVENLEPEETLQTSSSMNNWDENEMEEDFNDPQDFEENNYDWLSGIARPQSYWEERRQAWYQEMLNTSADNNEIRQLLERGTVSNFLASDFRDRMDQLMVSRVQTQVSLEDDELIEGSNERMGQLILSYFRRHLHAAPSSTGGEQHEVNRPGGEAEEEEERREGRGGGGGEEEESPRSQYIEEGSPISRYIEEESPTSRHYVEATDYFDQSSPSMHSPLPFRSWNFSNQREVADDYERVSTTPSQWPPPSRASNRDQQSSSTSHPSIEMELLYDLRGHIEQLQHEMFELRKSIQSCVDMQVKLQNSTKQQHLVQGEGKNSLDRVPTRRSCCVCYEMQVDSFLYRCGHMCTCLRCAHELQWSSGKCPICRAPILDVVRAYMDS